MAKKHRPIDYTSRDYEKIRDDLLDYARRYYPTTFKDFNEASFGALMIDAVAYVGDIMSFYLDYQANESFMDTSIEFDNVVKQARQLGYKFKQGRASHGLLDFYVSVPANANGIGPDTDYMPVLKRGSIFSTPGGVAFTLLDDVDFSASKTNIVVSSANADTGAPTYYAVKASGRAISGETKTFTKAIGSFESFLEVDLGDTDVTEILSVTDSEGREYFEVDHLSQNIVYKSIRNKRADKENAPYLLQPVAVARRFMVEQDRGTTTLVFGYGSDSEVYNQSVADPREVILNLHGKDYVTDTSFDPYNLVKTDKFGISPRNTTLTVTYRVNTSSDVNAAADTVTNVDFAQFEFTDEAGLSGATANIVRNSLEVTNEERIFGDTTAPTVEEVKERASAYFATQGRAVTRHDYVTLVYEMPARYGSIKRATIFQDSDSFKRNLNLYVLSEDSGGSFVQTSTSIKENIKIWLYRNKMINDTIDILDAQIVNIGIEFSVVGEADTNKYDVLSNAQIALMDLYRRQFQIGEPIEIAQIYKKLNATPGVVDTLDVQLVRRGGIGYSDVSFNIEDYMSVDGRVLSIPKTHVFEIRSPGADIKGTIT